MPIPLIAWAGVAIAGLYVAGDAAKKAGEAAEGASSLAKWATIGGGLYVSYAALRASGALK